jgi:hypothetical protein
MDWCCDVDAAKLGTGNLSANFVLNAFLGEAVLRFIGELLVDRSAIAHHLGDGLAIFHEAPEVIALQFAGRRLGLPSVVRPRGSEGHEN